LVLIPASPLPESANLPELFQREELSTLIRGPLSMSAGILVDAVRGQAVAQIIQSMRSQMTVSISPARLEFHDQSGRDDLAEGSIVPLACALADLLNLTRISAVGANYTYEVRNAARGAVSHQIAQTVLRETPAFVPDGINLPVRPCAYSARRPVA
jgi:hypothetical protein